MKLVTCLLATLLDTGSDCPLYCVNDFFLPLTETRPVEDNLTFSDVRTSDVKSDWSDDATSGQTSRINAEVQPPPPPSVYICLKSLIPKQLSLSGQNQSQS